MSRRAPTNPLEGLDVISTKLKFIASLILSAATLPAMAAQPLHFSMSYLGQFVPAGMNNLGQVVGWGIANDMHTAVVHDGSGLNFLGSPSGTSYAYGINDSGQIVGKYGDSNQAYTYSGGTFTNIGTAGSSAASINNAGQIVGTQQTPDWQTYGFVYQNGTLTNLTPANAIGSYAGSINNNGQIGGAVRVDSVGNATIFQNGTTTDLTGSLPSGFADTGIIDINDNGQALLGRNYYFDMTSRSYFYANGVATELGLLNNSQVYGHALNNAGLVIGGTDSDQGFLWQGGVTYDLNTLVSGLGGWHIEDAIAINDNNQIAAYACRGFYPGGGGAGECGTLLLSAVAAVPEPSTYAMMVGGLGLLGFAARRRRPAAQA